MTFPLSEPAVATPFPRQWLSFAVAALVLGFLFFQISPTVADPDLWGHVRFGQDIWESGRIVQTDPYSYLTEGYPWINHEWLAEVSFFLAWHIGGTAGLVTLKTTLAMLIYGLAFLHLCRVENSRVNDSRPLEVLLAGLLMLPVLVTTKLGLSMLRPQIYTYLFFLVTLLIIERAEKGRYRWLWAMPIVIALWANFHGGVLAGVGVFGIWCAVHLAWGFFVRPRLEIRRSLTVAVSGLLSLAALSANPFGVALPMFLIRTATVPRPEVPEWHPISFGGREDYVYLLMAAVGLAALALSKRPRRPALVVVFLVTVLLPWSAYRHVPLFALAFVVLAGEHVADLWNRRTAKRQAEPRFPGHAWARAIALVLFLGGLGLVVLSVPHFRTIHFGPKYDVTYPTRAVALLKASGVKGNLVILYDWGEYALWHLYPNIRVSMDGRRETVYSEAIYAEDMAFRYGLEGWDAVLKRSETDMALVSKDFACYRLLLKEPGWELVYEDPLCSLFTRSGGKVGEQLKQTPVPKIAYDGDGMAFP